MMFKRLVSIAMLLIVTALIAYPLTSQGTLTIKVTNSSKDGVEHLYVRCSTLMAHFAEEHPSSGWVSTSDKTMDFDLTTLYKSTEVYASVKLPIGQYDKLKLKIFNSTAVIKGSEISLLFTKSDLEVPVDFSVKPNSETILQLDFNVNFRDISERHTLEPKFEVTVI